MVRKSLVLKVLAEWGGTNGVWSAINGKPANNKSCACVDGSGSQVNGREERKRPGVCCSLTH